MANHCIDVVCAGCGRCWCLRGCGFDNEPSAEIAEIARRRHALRPGHDWEGERCCKGFPVLSMHITHGDKDPEPLKSFWDRIGEDS